MPNLSDWGQAGRVLARLAEKYDYEQIGQGRLTNDALIAMSAGRLGVRWCFLTKRGGFESPASQTATRT